jgi:geranylgeranyl diphosphate synthase, type I
MGLNEFSSQCMPAVEAHLQMVVDRLQRDGINELHQMLAYHMGWEALGDDAGAAGIAEARGKRIRPLLVLLVAAASGGRWQDALPAAAAVELLHNFSLIHDDIEDNSPLRRGRVTLWSRWGIPLAINAGDAMFTLAFLSLQDLGNAATAHQAMGILLNTSLHLTEGQHLDISYENRHDLTLDDYWPMISGKTAALLAACCELGALSASAEEDVRQEYRRFGQYLGLAFQAQDDLLGIWGDSLLTGKSAKSDLVEGKKSLPVLYGLGRQGAFAARWTRGAISMDEVPAIAELLAVEGAKTYSEQQVQTLTSEALGALERAKPQGAPGEALRELADRLLNRRF